MKMMVYSCAPDEEALFRRWAPEYGMEASVTPASVSRDTVSLAAGCDCVNITSEVVLTPDLLDAFAALGVRLIACRTVGYEHVDLDHARALGLGVTHITYSPVSVADFALMLMLMVTRNAKSLMLRSAGQDYTMPGLRGRELPGMTVGIVGTGRIGSTLARHLSGFGCRLLAWSPHPKAELSDVVTYTSLDTLLTESDIVSLHLQAVPETVHFIDRAALAKMKEGAILINTARGSLVDAGALIDAIESGKLGGAGLDVVEGDREIYYRDFKNQVVGHRAMAVLNSFPNVILMPHAGYYTDQAGEDMVRNSLEGSAQYLTQGSSPWQVN